MDIDSNQARKALVAFVIEHALLKISSTTLDQVSKSLYENYHCYFGDCYEHPEYLAKVLKDLFGNSHTVIVESIKKELMGLTVHPRLKDFFKSFPSKKKYF